MVSNKFKRDFYQYGALKRPGRIDRTLFQDIPDCGDGFGGIQWMMLKAFGTLLLPRFVIEGCAYDGIDTLPLGYIMWDGEPIQVAQQTIVVANGEWLYINQNGVAHTTGVEATAQDGVVIYERDAAGTGFDVRFRLLNNVLRVLNLTAQDLLVNQNAVITGNADVAGDVGIGSDLEVDGVSYLDDTVIDGTLNMDGNQINDVANPTLVGDAVNLATLRGFMPVGTVLMYNGVGWNDNVSMVGWYQCNAANNIAHGVPDLEDQFIRCEATSGNTGGADLYNLAANQIPTHTSGGVSVNHTHSGTTANNSVNHIHSGTTNDNTLNHTHTVPKVSGLGGSYGAINATLTGTISTSNGSNFHDHDFDTGNQSVNHTHTITTGNESVDHTHTYTPVGFAQVENRPAYYSLIFICRAV